MPTINVDEAKRFDPSRYTATLLYDSDNMRVVLFALGPGQELSPHVSSSEVMMHAVEGQGSFIVGNDRVEARPGIIAVCEPNVPHGAIADGELVFVAVIAPRPA
ncbi:MAG: cupin domain-containing protein [Chloroflexi bacterium]|nr:cupin domain-containing protein [Chloroflexota bacterium]